MVNSYCSVPFLGFQFTHRSNRLCCSAMSSKKVSAKDFWYSDYIKEVRQQMQHNIYVSDCKKCYIQEKANVHSLRRAYSKSYKDIQKSDLPVAMDLDLSNFCNLKCIMCDANRSSQWAGSVSTVTKEQLDSLCSISNHIKHLTIQGGEPSIIPEYVYYFDYLEKIGIIGDIEINCISNMTNINNRFYELLSKFKKVKIIASIDAFESANDYIRYPSHFEKIEENLIELSRRNNIMIPLISSIQILSMYNFDEFINWLKKIHNLYKKNGKNFTVSINRVSFPYILNISNAPLALKTKFIKDLDAYEAFDLGDQFNKEIDSIKKYLLSSEPSPLLTGFDNISDKLCKFVEKIDTERKVKITDYIPNFYNYF